MSLVGDQFIASYLKDARAQVSLRSGRQARRARWRCPASAPPGLRRQAHGHGDVLRLHQLHHADDDLPLRPEDRQERGLPPAEGRLQPREYETKQVFYTEQGRHARADVHHHKKGSKLDGNNPTLLYGYGGFNVSLTPSFSVAGWSSGWRWAASTPLPTCAAAASTARVAPGRARRLKKQNVFDDFIAAAEWLIANKYTSPPKLAISGGSNGGLLVGACMTQRPDLFGAALPAVGVMDMLRFHKFTIGWAWVATTARPTTRRSSRRCTPTRRCTTSSPARVPADADHDRRPRRPRRAGAQLQVRRGASGLARSDGTPVLIRIETKAGHGAGKPTTKIIEDIADAGPSSSKR